MVKGEIAHNKEFLLFPQDFGKTWTEDTLKNRFVWERVNTQEICPKLKPK